MRARGLLQSGVHGIALTDDTLRVLLAELGGLLSKMPERQDPTARSDRPRFHTKREPALGGEGG